MADIIDDAQVIEQGFRDQAVAKARTALTYPKNVTGLCQSCGDIIDPRRLAVLPGARECIDCANA